jgi:hypothetical protein
LLRKTFLTCENLRLERASNEEPDDEEEETKETTVALKKRGNLIAVIGAAGSGVLNIFSQLIERFETRQHQVFDLNTLHSNELLKVLASLQNCSEAKGLVIVGIITSPIEHISPADVLRSLQSLGWTISSCLNVIQSQALQPQPTDMPRDRLGFETWVGCCKEIFHMGKGLRKNLIVLIDSDLRTTDELSSSIQSLMETVNVRADVVRMQPTNLWFNAEIIESISASVESTGSLAPKRSPLKYFSVRHSQEFPPLPSLHASQVSLPRDESSWDLERLQILLRKLFPRAVLSNTLQAADTHLPHIPNLTGIQLALFLARVKVFASRKREKGLAHFQSLIQHFGEHELASARSGIFGVHAIVALSPPLHDVCFVCVEACSSSIIIRPFTHRATDHLPLNLIQIIGSLTPQAVSLLKNVFQTCTPFTLEKRLLLTEADIPTSAYASIEQSSVDVPLPIGWWFDGTGYVDVHGTRLMSRPDIASLVQHHVQEKNKGIGEYNRLMETVGAYL